jgi:deazaflavin-dependent oxidoreductase (nitroreductase family)
VAATEPPTNQTTPPRLGNAEIREAAQRIAAEHTRNPLGNTATGGRLLSAMMLPFFAIRPPKGYGVITTTGRRTGKQRQKVVRAIRDENTVFHVMLRPPAVAIERPDIVSAWVHNIRADPRVGLHIRDGRFEGRARELDDPDELRRARQLFCETVVDFDRGECKLHLRGMPSREKIQGLNRYWFDTGIPLAVELDR